MNTRTEIFESNLRIAKNMSGTRAIKCVRTHIIAPRSRENLTKQKEKSCCISSDER